MYGTRGSLQDNITANYRLVAVLLHACETRRYAAEIPGYKN